MSEPRWSKIETHCVVCARPFATPAEETRHFEKECGDPCWCWGYCWIEQGGDCEPSEELSDDGHGGTDELTLYGMYRAWRELAESLARSSTGLGTEQ